MNTVRKGRRSAEETWTQRVWNRSESQKGTEE